MVPHANIFSDSINLGLIFKNMPQTSKHWFFFLFFFFFLGSLKLFHWPAGRAAATNKRGEMPSFGCKSAATRFLQQVCHSIPRLHMDFSTISIFTELLTFLANMSKSPDRTVITLKQYVRRKNGWDFLLLHLSNLSRKEGAGMPFHLLSSN